REHGRAPVSGCARVDVTCGSRRRARAGGVRERSNPAALLTNDRKQAVRRKRSRKHLRASSKTVLPIRERLAAVKSSSGAREKKEGASWATSGREHLRQRSPFKAV